MRVAGYIGSLVGCASLIAAIFGIHAAAASPILSENFDSDTQTLNWAGNGNFTSLPPPGNIPGQASVDLYWGWIQLSGSGLRCRIAG